MASLYRDDRTFFGVKDDTWTALALWAIMSYTGIISGINRLINLWTERPTSIDTLIVAAIFSILVMLGTLTAVKKMQRKEFLLAVLVVAAWIISFLLDENARSLLKLYYFKPVLLDGVCGIICISRFRDWEKFRRIGYFFVIFGLTLFLVNAGYIVDSKINENYMSFSYNYLTFVIACYWMAIHKNNIFLWVLAVLSTFVIVIAGCRGAIVCVGVYIFCELLLNKKVHKILKALIILALVLVFFNLENIMVNLDDMLSEYGYESRTIELFFEGDMQNDSGRSKYSDAAVKVIENNPILGCGMAGSSYHLFVALHDMKPVGIVRQYSHNLFLDIYMDYGILLGTVLIIWLLIQLVLAYIRSRGTYSQTVLFMLMAAILPKLMLSSTYVGEPLFFMLLGLLININDKKNDIVAEVDC